MRRLGLRRAFAARRAFAVTGLWAASIATAHADCVVVAERAPKYAPHVALHFGAAEDVPSDLQSCSPYVKTLPSFSIPIYAYNLGEGADAFDLALRLPRAPLGFDPGPAIVRATLGITTGGTGVLAGLRLESVAPVCGPVHLGSLRLATSDLPDDFRVAVESHPETSQCAVRDAGGAWRPLVVDAGGALVGQGASCPGACAANNAISDLAAVPGSQPGVLELHWTSGSGTDTIVSFRTDGRYPADPWDGELIAIVPSEVSSYPHRFDRAGAVHIAAWSVTRSASGSLDAASNIECGALASAYVHLPVGVSPRSWGQVKTTYR